VGALLWTTIQIDPKKLSVSELVDVDHGRRVNASKRKPKKNKTAVPFEPPKPKSLAPWVVYLFNADVLHPVLSRTRGSKLQPRLGQDILPKMVDDYRVFAYGLY